jgi:hypothetical protein
LKGGTNVLPSVAKKKMAVIAALVSSTKAFPMAGLALQLKMPTVATRIAGPKVGDECWNSGLDGRLEVVAESI